MTDTINLFPQGHAIGNAFCNREEERAKLKASFLNHEHTVIVAPRRYGKSSLIKQVIFETKIVGSRIDLLPATNMAFVHRALRNMVGELMNAISPRTIKAKQQLIELVKKLHPKLTISLFGQKLELSTSASTETSITEMLVGLNSLAAEVNKKVVVCLDEFQQIGELKNHHSMEAAIRHAVEASTHVIYVFSGSNRHLLSQMFHEKSRPLYHLCDLMKIDRIAEETYFPILKNRAKNKWQSGIEEAGIREILALTKCHPYYVNALCRQLWKKIIAPNVATIQSEWLAYIESQSNWISDDLARLSPNQRNILAALAYDHVDEPFSHDFSEKVRIGASSIKSALSILLRDDFVYLNKNARYAVLDPAVETYLHTIKNFDFVEE